MAGKNFVGRLGAELDCAPVTDILEVIDEETFVRPMYAGNAVATVHASDPLKILTVRPTSFEKAATTGGAASVGSAPTPENGADAGLASFVSESVSGGDRPDLTAARVVVSGGRGMKDGDNFQILEKLADKLGGAVGASRAAVDAGFVANELQVRERMPVESFERMLTYFQPCRCLWNLSSNVTIALVVHVLLIFAARRYELIRSVKIGLIEKLLWSVVGENPTVSKISRVQRFC